MPHELPQVLRKPHGAGSSPAKLTYDFVAIMEGVSEFDRVVAAGTIKFDGLFLQWLGRGQQRYLLGSFDAP